jgi:hypothetical protein
VGFAISDENNRIGLGFVPEYNGEAQFGSCSEYILVSISPLEQTRENRNILEPDQFCC